MTIALQLHADMHGGMSVMCVQLPVKGWQLGLNINEELSERVTLLVKVHKSVIIQEC